VNQKVEDLLPTIYEQGGVPFILVLDGITDVRNFGAIARSAECAGVNCIVVPLKGSAQANADAMKTSAGALNIIPVCRETSLAGTCQFLKESGLKIFAASEKAEKPYYKTDLREPLVIVMGAEDVGVSSAVMALCDEALSIPMVGEIKSLNVSVAAGILLFEALKQRGGAV
jgi:23S rRNA (guanosine2251-2'-O)-methyltransferase